MVDAVDVVDMDITTGMACAGDRWQPATDNQQRVSASERLTVP